MEVGLPGPPQANILTETPMRITTQSLFAGRKFFVRCFVLLLLAFCAALAVPHTDGAKSKTLIIIGEMPRNKKSILDLRIETIELRNIRMYAALRQIQEAVRIQSKGRIDFYFEPDWSRAERDEYVKKRIPVEKWKFRDPRVSLTASDKSLKDVIDQLCFQSGWSYAMASFGGPHFIDDKSLWRLQQ